jgi:hypothetical protein
MGRSLLCPYEENANELRNAAVWECARLGRWPLQKQTPEKNGRYDFSQRPEEGK